MPSIQHEALVQLFRNQPGLAVQLLERALGLRVPAHRVARLEDTTLTQVVPTEYAVDAVVELLDEHGPVHAIVVEVQLSNDNKKPYAWPVYATSLRARLRCPVSVLVVTPSAVIAAWASQPIDLGFGSTFQPLVVGPDAVPRVTSVADASDSPELAVLSVLAHGQGERPQELAQPALHVAARLDPERAKLYADLILSALGPAARVALEEMMKSGYQYQSEFAKKYMAQGRAEGELHACREALASLLEQRFGALPEPLRERIAAETDLGRLREWLARVLTIGSLDELDA